ncbi:hypothetical protein AB0K12_03470 [Nonomuraea sp. NPDC049419]|uniref:hypothetical protein n=1 Tax=Nonomuraea sp. NPDC049419 TaxID=3155772 RepID=UPI0034145DF5
MVMTDEQPRNGSPWRRPGRAAPDYCGDGCRCALWELPREEPFPGTEPPPEPREYHPDPAVLSYAETCALLGGTQTGLHRLLEAAEAMRAGRNALITAHHDATAALNAYETFVTEGRHAHLVGRACRAERARTEQAAAPPLWLRVLRWPAIIMIGAFDVWFFQQYFLDIGYTGTDEDPGWIHGAIALVPGIAVVFMILLGATLVGGLVRGWTRRLDGAGRVLKLLRVIVPMGYLALVLSMVGYFAYLRAYESFAELRRSIEPEQQVLLVAGLIGLLTLTSILMKVKGDDPEADAVFVARLRRRRSDRACAKTQAQVKAALARLGQAYSDLRAVRDEGLSRFRDAMLEAYRRGILEPRAQHRPGTEVPPALTLPPSLQEYVPDGSYEGRHGSAPDSAANGSRPERGAAAREYARLLDDSLVDGAGPLLPEFEDIRQPRPSLGPLPEICRVLAVTDPGPLKERWRELDERLNDDVTRLSG